jgi:hypothetical protein
MKLYVHSILYFSFSSLSIIKSQDSVQQNALYFFQIFYVTISGKNILHFVGLSVVM